MSKIQAPSWCEHAIPTQRGWEDPNSGEVYKSGGFSQSQINEFYGKTEAPQMLTEAPANNVALEKMTKVQLESLGRQHGVELDRRKNKKSLVATMKGLLIV